MAVRSPVLEFLQTRAVPVLRQSPLFAPHDATLAYAAVGAAAWGLAGAEADLEVAVLADDVTYDALAADPGWATARAEPRGDPRREPLGELWSEVRVDGFPVRYVCSTRSRVEAAIQALDDVAVFRYARAVPLYDPTGRCARLAESLLPRLSEVRKQRLEGKLDLLRRRFANLEAAIRQRDVVGSSTIALEMVVLVIKVTALLDDVPFDPRRHLLAHGLAGRLGYRLEEDIRQLFPHLGDLGRLSVNTDPVTFRFPVRVAAIISVLSEEARRQGFRVGLQRPDPRCAERWL
ncbi:MAG: hypothetical protein K6U08_04080 [Firmicutes bacterium]|nr:hypothetical protein [Bacillota bacterium]